MNTRLIGIGAAGNKAAITAVENLIIDIRHTMLINSTLKDISTEYKNKDGAIVRQFAGATGGCGKERSKAYQLGKFNLQKDTLGLEDFLSIGTPEQAELVIVVSSTEGGTGSGSAPLIANYIRSVYGISVHVFAIAGFEEDVRGMKNTVEFFKEIYPTLAVECIKNSKFLSSNGNSRIKAEKAANVDFCQKISVLMGLQIRDSEHNIDPTDLLNLVEEEGYCFIETCIFKDRIKNTDQFRTELFNTLSNSKNLDIDTYGISKLGVIINIREDETDYIEYNDILEEKFGVPHVKYEHVQYESKTMPSFISVIATGMKMPAEEIEKTYNNYLESTAQVNKSKDNFFDTIKDAEFDSDDASFNLKDKSKSVMDKNSFFNDEPKKEFTTRPKGVTSDY